MEGNSSLKGRLGAQLMRLLKRLFGGTPKQEADDPRPLLGWLGDDPEAVELGQVEDFEVFLRDVRETVPEDSVLALEGKPASDVREFLEEVQVTPRIRLAHGTAWPKDHYFHVPATRANLDRLLEFMQNHALPEICDHVVLYKHEQLLLWLHGSGDGYVYGHPALGHDRLEQIRSGLRHKRPHRRRRSSQ